MRMFVSVLVLTSAALLTCVVHAAPTNSTDDLDKIIADNSFLTQIDRVRQTVQSKTSELVGTAMGFLGVRYKRGGTSAETGFDCSGFVRAIYEQTAGLLLPHRAEQQAAVTQRIDKAELQPGDLVFFNTMRRAFSHVGIYVGNGKFIHSPKPGAEVRVEDLNLKYWARRFDGARRVKTETAAPETPQINLASPAFNAIQAGSAISEQQIQLSVQPDLLRR